VFQKVTSASTPCKVYIYVLQLLMTVATDEMRRLTAKPKGQQQPEERRFG